MSGFFPISGRSISEVQPLALSAPTASPSYLWRVATFVAGATLLAHFSTSFDQPARQAWRYSASQASGVIPGQGPESAVLVRSEPFRTSAPQSWPFGRQVSVAQQSQPFHIWYRLPTPTIEPESWSQPVLFGFLPVGGVVQPQPFHIWAKPAKADVVAEDLQVRTQNLWPFGRTVSAVQTVQSFNFWPGASQRNVDISVESYSVPASKAWPFSLTYTVQPWNWWQRQPAEPVPDTSQYYEYRSRDFAAEWRLFWVTATTPVITIFDDYIVRHRHRGSRR